MKRMNKFSKRYYREVKLLFPSIGGFERSFLSVYEKHIQEHLDANPDITYEELVDSIGKPTDIINAYYASADTEYLIRKLRTAKIIRRTVCAIIVAILLSIAVFVGTRITLYNDIQQTLPIRTNTHIY